MKSKHIIQVSAYYPPHLGGQENVVHDLASQLASAGHEVQVLTSAVGGQVGSKLEQGVRVQRLCGLVFGHAPIMPKFPAALHRAAGSNSLVHLHIGQAFTPEMVWLVSKLRRFKYIAELHIDFQPSGPAGVLLPLYKRLVLKRVLQAADAVVTLNKKTLQLVRDVYGCAEEKTYILPNGIDEAYFRLARRSLPPKPPQTLRLLFVGRLSRQKNVLALLEALSLTKRRVRLDLIGEGEEQAAIRQAIADHSLKQVKLHGRLEREAVMKFYQTSHALVMPSLYEAQPLVLLEAMAARLPIIGTNVIGLQDHLKTAGIMVEPTAEGLAEGIERYYTQYAQLPRLVEHGFELAQHFRWRRVLKQYEALYETVA